MNKRTLADMADKLPDEIWLKILGYISLEDRIRNIQFCCKRFHKLCADNAITHNLDFSKTVFLPEGMCLNVINKAQEHISRLSFKGCHWLNSSLFMDIPHLPALESLNIKYYLLDVDKILSLLQKVPKLKNLALSLPVEQMRYIYEHSIEIQPELHLQRLHVHIYREKIDAWHEDQTDVRNVWPNYSEYIYNVFFPDRLAECISVEIRDETMPNVFGKISRTMADFGRYDLMEFYDDIEIDCKDICRFARKLGMHKPLLHEGDISPILDLSQVKYLALPEVCPVIPNWTCADAVPPHSLPSLEYLQCSWKANSIYECYDKLTYGIMFDCELTSLRYLHFLAKSTLPMKFYTNLAQMKNLQELRVCGSCDSQLLLTSVQSLCGLESLHIPIPNTNIDGRPYLECLASAVPRLKKLCVEITQVWDNISNYFEPIPKLVFLQDLHIYITDQRIISDEVDVLCTALKSLHRLTALKLKFLPNLVHLTLITYKAPTQNILDAAKECEKLETLWIEELQADNPIQGSTLIPLLIEVATSMPRLHLLAVCSNGFSNSVKESVKELNVKLQKEPRKMSVYCGNNSCKIPAVFDAMRPLSKHWLPPPLDCFELETRVE